MIEQAAPISLERNGLLDQQLWFLGRDIGARSGNGLLAYGFERRRSASGSGSSVYLLPLATSPASASRLDGRLICWGFGIYAGAVCEPGAPVPPATGHEHAMRAAGAASHWAGATLERFCRTPGLIRAPMRTDIHQVAALPSAHVPHSAFDRAFAARAIRTIALTLGAYERWAIATLGIDHREAALRDAPRHKRHRFTRLPDLSGLWDALARLPAAAVHPDREHALDSAAA